MKKRLLALLLAVVIIVGLVAMGIPASAAESETNTYEVGYAKVDVNPWIINYPDAVNMTDESGNAIGIAYNPDWSATDIADYVTTVSLSDGNGGTKTVGIIKSRLGGAGTAKSNYAAGVLDDNGDGKIGLGDGLQITATTVTDTAGKTVVFITIDCIGGNNTLYKDHLRTSLVTEINNAGGFIDANSIYLSGSHTHNAPDMTDLATASSGTPLNAYWGYYIAQVKKAALAAFNSRTPATMSKGSIKASDVIGCEMNFIRHHYTDGAMGGMHFGASSNSRSVFVSEADDAMYLLKFTPTDNTKKSTVLVNWRAHGTFIGGTQSKNYSSDYIGPLRTYLEAENYNVAFLQGAAGNVVPEKLGSADSPWKAKYKGIYPYPGASGAIQDLKDANLYGRLLSNVALTCLDQEEMKVNLNTGNIQYNFIYYLNTSPVYSCELQKDSPGLQAAATAWVKAGKPDNDDTWPYKYNYPTDGKCYILNSSHHASKVYSRIGNADTQNISIGAIMLGSQVAMVTSSYELFDRYSATDTIENIIDGDASNDDNDWLDLEDERYGTPFVLAYTNGHHSYMPNYLSYTYNEGSDTYGAGSYEANTSPFAQGTGEKLIVQFKKMLTELAGNTTDDATGPVVSGSSYYDTLAEAVEDVGEKALIELLDNVSLDDALTISKDLYLDLNGKSITFNNDAKIVIDAEKTLYCKDSATADFTVKDDVYTRIPKAKITGEGNVEGVPLGSDYVEEGCQYYMNDDGTDYSFHCVKLDTYAITLQAKDNNSEDPSIYYTSDFAGDEIVQSKVQSYGVALSILEAPDADNIETHCQKTNYSGFDSGSSTGTLLYNILNTNNVELVNRRNANTKVYGKAYVITDEGYLFGNLADYSLKDVVESINNSWDRYETTQKDSAVNMLESYAPITQSWNIANLRSHKINDNSLNILVIGNSHGLDSTRMLYEVFKAEKYPGGLVIANLYKGGCTMAEHADFLTNNKARYEYHKISSTGVAAGYWTCQTGATGLAAMQDEQWDIVILQQANQDSGIATEFKENQLNAVMNYVKANQISTPEFAWNMLWANPDDYAKFLDYNETELSFAPLSIGRMTSSTPTAASVNEVKKFRTNLENHFATNGVYQQEKMYAAITANVNRYSDYIAEENLKNGYEGAVKVNPAGTAVMKAQMLLQNKGLADQAAQLCVFRDYTHLSHYGRLITAYTLYCTLTGNEEIGENAIIEELPQHLNKNQYDDHTSTYGWSNSYPTLQNNKYTFTDQDKAILTEAVNWALTNPDTVEN